MVGKALYYHRFVDVLSMGNGLFLFRSAKMEHLISHVPGKVKVSLREKNQYFILQ